jgi:ribosomal protein S18 acetylase RimI-like enzyme
VVRTIEYLNWKYAYPGIGDFRKFIAREKGMILGYMVLRINRYNPNYPVGYIVDLVTEEGRDDVVSELIDRALLYFEEEDVNIVNFLTVKNQPDIKILKSYGFIDSRIIMNLYTSQIKPKSLETLAKTNVPPKKIMARWGDHDVLPVSLSHYE